MKPYLASDYQDWNELSIHLTNDLLEADLLPINAIHKAYGPCTIETFEVSFNENQWHVMATINFENGQTKALALDILMANNLIQLDDHVHNELVEHFEAFTKLQKEAYEVAHDRSVAKHEASRKAAEEAKQEAKYQAAKEKAIQDFEVQMRKPSAISEANGFYYALGWLAKYMGSLTAKLPDYLGPAFERYFGSDVPKTLVDSRAKTIGGYAKQWSWEFKCSIKKLNETTVPVAIRDVTTDFSKGIHNTSFLWDLVANHGFQFGKKQDLEKIKDTIPSAYLSHFEKGYAA